MELEERENEIILEKLERMEDFLKSFIAGLGETSEKKGRRRITADIPIHGKIAKWHRGDGRVEYNDPLCRIDWGSSGIVKDSTEIAAPVKGVLHILVGEEEEVDPGQPIAYIDEIIDV